MNINNNPLISVIIPIYNVEKFLPQCLDSVVNQTYRNLEIILVNDGSPDNSDAICKEYLKKDNRLVYYNRQNSGASASRNFGIDHCNGDYIFFLDSDDYLDAECIEKLFEHSEPNKLSITGYYLDFSNDKLIEKPEQGFGFYSNLHEFWIDFYKYFATKTNFIWGRLFESSIIMEYNIRFDPSMALSEDLLFDLEYYRHCINGFAVIEHCGYYYRQHGTSTLSKKFNPKMFDWNESAYQAVRDFLIEYDVMTEQNKRHLYNNILGNLLYSTELLCFAKEIPFNRKMELVRHYTSTQLAKETFTNAGGISFRTKMESAMMKNCPFVYFIYNHFVIICRQIKKKIK